MKNVTVTIPTSTSTSTSTPTPTSTSTPISVPIPALTLLAFLFLGPAALPQDYQLLDPKFSKTRTISQKLGDLHNVKDANPVLSIDIADGADHPLGGVGGVFADRAEFIQAFGGSFPESDKVFNDFTGSGWESMTLAWASIWKTIHSAPAGSEIFFPCGTYVIKPQITSKQNIRLRGESPGCAKLKVIAGGWAMADNAGQRGLLNLDSYSGIGNYGDGVTIDGLYLESVYSTSPSSAPQAIFVGGASHVTIRNCTIKDTPEPIWQGGQAYQNPFLLIVDNTFIDTWGLQMTCRSCRATGNTLYWTTPVTGSFGIQVTGLDVKVDNNVIKNPEGFGIYAGDNTGTTAMIDHNWVTIDGTGYDGAGVKACFSSTIGSLQTTFEKNTCTIFTDAATGVGKVKGAIARYYGNVDFVNNTFDFKIRQSQIAGFTANNKVDVKEDQGDTFSNDTQVYIVSPFPTAGGLNESTLYYIVNRGAAYSSGYYSASVQLATTEGGSPVTISANFSGYLRKNTTTKVDGITLSPSVVANQNNQGTITANITGNVFHYRNHNASVVNKVVDCTINSGAVCLVNSSRNLIEGLASNNSYAVYLPKEVSNIVSSLGDVSTTAASFVVDTHSWYSSTDGHARYDSTAEFPISTRAIRAELLNLGGPVTKTIASGVVDLSGATPGSGADCRSYLLFDTESSAATDDLDSITGCTTNGNVITIGTTSASRDIFVTAAGNIAVGSTIALTETQQRMTLIYSSALSKWVPAGMNYYSPNSSIGFEFPARTVIYDSRPSVGASSLEIIPGAGQSTTFLLSVHDGSRTSYSTRKFSIESDFSFASTALSATTTARGSIDTHNSSTTFLASNGQKVLEFRNRDTTTNNWSGILSWMDGGGTGAAALGVQITDQTNHYGKFDFRTRAADGLLSRLVVNEAGLNIPTGAVYQINGSQISTSDLSNSSAIPLWVAAPATATDACIAGQMARATGFLYVCVSTNSWERSVIAAW